MFGRKKVAVVVAEFLGTYVLASSVLAVVTNLNIPFFAAAAAGLALATMVLVIGPVSGSHINPAVTFGLWTLRKISTPQAIVYVAAQFLAGFLALRVNERFLDQTLPKLAEAAWDWRIALAEALGTLIFTFGIAAAVYNKYEGGRLAAAIGASLFIGILAASFGSNGALNPAVALGLNSWSVAYLIAPLVGSAIGMNLYALLFAPAQAQTARPPRKK